MMADAHDDIPLAVYRLPPADPEPPAAPAAGGDPAEAALLWQHGAWFRRLRWLVVAALAATGLAALAPAAPAAVGLGIAPDWPWTVAALLAAANLVYARWAVVVRSARAALWAQIAVDLVLLTAVVHYVGSTGTYAPFAYLLHIVLACVFFPAWESLAVTALAAALYLGCLALEASGAWPATTVLLDAPAAASAGRPTLHTVSAFALWGAIWGLVSQLAARLRRRERELALSYRRLKAGGEERMRHMIQTTHQLKAPFAAIHAQTQLLTDGYCGPIPAEARAVLGRIADRCRALSQQIHDMLQLANLRSESQAAPPRQEVDVAELMQAALAKIAPAAAHRNVRIAADLAPARVEAVEDHLRMVFDNLVTNAVTYSRDGGEVRVETRPAADGGAAVVVADGGIGIAAEKLPHVFQDYYRTKEAVRYNPSSTGLGLAIVRDVARADGLGVEVVSAPGRGARFSLSIPCRPPAATGVSKE